MNVIFSAFFSLIELVIVGVALGCTFWPFVRPYLYGDGISLRFGRYWSCAAAFYLALAVVFVIENKFESAGLFDSTDVQYQRAMDLWDSKTK